jgi:hypothetical protein
MELGSNNERILEMISLAWTLLVCSSATAQRYEEVSFIEINHVKQSPHSEFRQVILWRWDSQYRRHDVVGWWIAEDKDELPTRRNGTWFVRKKGIVFHADWMFCSWTNTDVEVEHQRLRKCEDRLRFW